ncbi:unnamed protein product [Prorocentrum cordatum]|uniref:Uncharacterized protein n=1 Tax=Prorocentrum cordatum TaxID=2364126 RepID=A0ABN9Q672_9DINO|nr:unnamed protein product [Polarella glacialis]
MIMLSSRFSVESERRGHQTEALMLDNEELHDTVRGLQRQLQSYAVETQSLREELLEVQGSWRVDLLRQVQGFWKDDAGEFYGGACVEFSENGWRVHESSLHLRSKTARSEAMLGSAVYTWRIEPPRIVLHEQRQDGGECRELVLTVGGQGLLVVRCPVESSVWNLTPDSRRSALSPFGRASRSPGARVPPSSCGTPASPCSPSMAAGDGEEVPGHEPLEAEEVRRLREELAEGEWKLREAEGCVAQYQQALAENSELRAALQHERERSATRLSRISSLEQDVEAFSSWGPPQAAAETARGSGHKRPSLAAELASFHGGPGEEELGGDLQAELHRLRDFARRHEQAAEARGACGQAPAAEPRPPAGGEATPGSEPEPDMAEVLSLMGQLGQLAGAFHSFGAAPPGAHRG